MRSFSVLLVVSLVLAGTPALANPQSENPFARPSVAFAGFAQADAADRSEEDADLQAQIEALRAERDAISDAGAERATAGGAIVGILGVITVLAGGIYYGLSSVSFFDDRDGRTRNAEIMLGVGGAAAAVGGISLYSGHRNLKQNAERRRALEAEIRELRERTPAADGFGIGPGPPGTSGVSFHAAF